MNWSLYGARGLRSEVKAKILKADKVPEDVRNCIAAEIDLLPACCQFVRVDAYGQIVEHRGAHGSYTRNMQSTVVGHGSEPVLGPDDDEAKEPEQKTATHPE